MRTIWICFFFLCISGLTWGQDTLKLQRLQEEQRLLRARMSLEEASLEELEQLEQLIWQSRMLTEEQNRASGKESLQQDSAFTRLMYQIKLRKEEKRDSNFYTRQAFATLAEKQAAKRYRALSYRLQAWGAAHKDARIGGALLQEAYFFYNLAPTIFLREQLYNSMLQYAQTKDNFGLSDMQGYAVGRERHAAVAAGNLYVVQGDTALVLREADGDYRWETRGKTIWRGGKYWQLVGRGGMAMLAQEEAGQLNLLEVRGGDCKRIISLEVSGQTGISNVLLGREQPYMLVLEAGTWRCINWETQEERQIEVAGFEGEWQLSSDDRYLVFFGRKAQQIALWDLSQREQPLVADIKPKGKEITALALSKNILWTGDANGRIANYDIELGMKPLFVWRGEASSIAELKISNDGRCLAAKDKLGNITLFEQPLGQGNAVATHRLLSRWPNATLTFSSDNTSFFALCPTQKKAQAYPTDLADYQDLICRNNRARLSDNLWRKYIGTDGKNKEKPYIQLLQNKQHKPSDCCPHATTTLDEP